MAIYTTLVKSQLLYCYRLFHECKALNHQAYRAGSVLKISAGIDLVPLVERGGGWLEHDQEFLSKSTQPRGWVEAAGPGQYLPGDSEGGPLVLELPHVV